MKKELNFLFVLMFLATKSFSQNKGYVSISMGPSFPIGNFASKNVNNNFAGWASTGIVLDINIAYKLGRNFGLFGSLRGQTNNFDNAAFATELANQTGYDWSVSSKPWSIGGLMFGGYGSFPVSKKVSFDTKSLIGILRIATPEINSTLSGSGGSVWVKQNSVNSISFTYLLGSGFKFDITEKICLMTHLDYLVSKPEFRNVEIITSDGGAPLKSTFTQNIQTINFFVGVGLRL